MTSTKALGNHWLFTPRGAWDDLTGVAHHMNSVTTMERDADENEVIEWMRDHPRRPISEWSDYSDPFELAGLADWSPLQSVVASPKAASTVQKRRAIDFWCRGCGTPVSPEDRLAVWRRDLQRFCSPQCAADWDARTEACS